MCECTTNVVRVKMIGDKRQIARDVRQTNGDRITNGKQQTMATTATATATATRMMVKTENGVHTMLLLDGSGSKEPSILMVYNR